MDNKYGLGSSKVAVELHKKKEGMKCRLAKVTTSFLPHYARSSVREMW